MLIKYFIKINSWRDIILFD